MMELCVCAVSVHSCSRDKAERTQTTLLSSVAGERSVVTLWCVFIYEKPITFICKSDFVHWVKDFCHLSAKVLFQNRQTRLLFQDNLESRLQKG